jgi:dolichol-phosphate mannosyltransferase
VLACLLGRRITARGYSFQIEMSYRAWKKGFRLREVPIVFTDRKRGGSKISGGIVYEALYLIWRLRLQVALEPRPAPPADAEAKAATGDGPAPLA